MIISDKYGLVFRLLTEKEIYRDDYRALLARVWWEEMQDKEISAVIFLHLLKSKKISHPESIMRARRKVQEQNPHLLGRTGKYRKTHSVSETRLDLGYRN